MTRKRVNKLSQLIIVILIAVLALPTYAPVAAVPPAQTADLPDPNLFLDADWYREHLIQAADLWNGGLDGQSGMGAYREDFNGFFHVALDREWQQISLNGGSTPVAQSRAIYMNVEAYRAAGPEEGQRFLQALNQGVDFLLAIFRDPKYGGFYWAAWGNGSVVDDMKDGYVNVHVLFALAQAYSVTQNPTHLDAALEQLAVIESHFLDREYPGGILPGFDRTYSRTIGVKNVDPFTHLFEALLALYDVTEGEQQAHVADLITLCGDFLTQKLYHDQTGYTDRGYVAFNYTITWEPSQEPYARELQWYGALHTSTGHNIELAYLISRAVERGFNEEWLMVADKLLKFCTEYTIDPRYGGMLYTITDYDGKMLKGNPDNAVFLWWPQAETARALLHFSIVRNPNYTHAFKSVETLFHQYLTDQEFGGLYHSLDVTTLKPVVTQKGNIWKTNYRFSMFFAEALRLSAQYPERFAELNAQP